MPSTSSSATVPAGITYVQVAAAEAHTVAIGSDGRLYSWGQNNYTNIGTGMLGQGLGNALVSSPAPVNTEAFGSLTFSAVSATGGRTLALGSNGVLYGWGRNNTGKLGDGSTTDKNVPVPVDTPLTFSQISAGQDHSVALTSEGKAYSWGASNAIGDGATNTLAYTPVPVLTTLTFSKIATGVGFTLALTGEGKLYGWGSNNYYQLGLGDTTLRSSPATISEAITFSSIAAGAEFSFALTSEGTIYSWGRNSKGQLGLGTTSSIVSVPMSISSDATFTQVVGGYEYAIARTDTGILYGWGHNHSTNKQAGVTTTSTEIRSPALVDTQSSGVMTFSAISAGSASRANHTFALGSNGYLYGWGSNFYGALGTGNTDNLPYPTLMPAYFPGPSATVGSTASTPSTILGALSCTGSCGDGTSFSFSALLSTAGQSPIIVYGDSTTSNVNLTFDNLLANTTYTLEVSVGFGGATSETTSMQVTTAKPVATISALSVADISATLTVGCTNCGTVPDSFTISATPVAGGQAITSNTNLISGLSSETTYSFSVVVAFAGTTSDVVLWQSNPVMTLPFVPIISAVSPPAVPLTGGSITVVGSNFTTSTELTLDGATLSFTIVSGTQITFTAPSDTAGSYDLAITNPVGTYTLSNAITYVAGPTLVTNSPVLGTTNGGTIVTLTGTDLITTNQVNVGSTTVSFSVISNSVVRFVTAATSAGVVDIGVVTIGGAATLSSALEFTSSPLIPVVSSITPTSGPNSGGTLITVTGQYFSGSYSDSVSAAINGVSGSSVILIDDSTLTFVSPAGTAGAALDVSVATGGGLGALAGAFTYTAPPVPVAAGSAPAVAINTPTITEFSTRKISASGAQVSATGLRLENISVLTLGGITVTIVSNTATTLTFTTGEMPVGIWDLRLVASNGTLVFQQAIEVIEIQEISAESTGERIGFAVTLRFSGNSRVLNDQQEGHLQRRLRSDADTIICWGYTTSQDPKSWALAHANARAQAACNLALEGMPGVSSIVRLRYGMPKDLAMRAAVQFWKVVE